MTTKTALLIAVSMWTSLPHAAAQIIYTDVIPDQVYAFDSCLLDLNNDGDQEYILKIAGGVGICALDLCYPILHPRRMLMLPDTLNEMMGSSGYPACLAPGEPIDGLQAWSADSIQTLRRFSVFCTGHIGFGCERNMWTGTWTAASVDSSRFLGLRFDLAGMTHYGWARVSVDSLLQSFTLKDYAYNTVPGDMIPAGDTLSLSTGIYGPSMSKGACIVPDPFSSSATLILSENAREGAIMTITDAFGRTVRQIAITGTHTTLERGTLASGMYLYRIDGGAGGRMVGRFIIE